MDSRISLTKQFIKDLLNETRRDSVSPARLAGIYQRIIDIVDDDAASREEKGSIQVGHSNRKESSAST